MQQGKLLAIGWAMLAAGVASAQPDEAQLVSRGETLFERHCAACHGRDGRGNGPVARTLTKQPADLTTIAQRNGGVFDADAVRRQIDGREAAAAHGTREMPVWGAYLAWPQEEGQTSLGLEALVAYLKSIQRER